jgi:hypothetical protein
MRAQHAYGQRYAWYRIHVHGPGSAGSDKSWAEQPSAVRTGPAPMSTDQHGDRPHLDARDALAQLGELSFENTSMDAMLQRIADLAKQVIPDVADASVSLIANDRATTAAYTGRLALDLD